MCRHLQQEPAWLLQKQLSNVQRRFCNGALDLLRLPELKHLWVCKRFSALHELTPCARSYALRELQKWLPKGGALMFSLLAAYKKDANMVVKPDLPT